MNVLEVRNCTVCYQNGVPAVKDVSLSVQEGEIISIVGESGSGKTTLIRTILGLLPPGGHVMDGSIIFENRDLVQMTAREMQAICGSKIAMIFQDAGAALDPILRIKTQYRESIAVHERHSIRECDAIAEKMLRRMHLTDVTRVMDAYPFELSGGMKQRVGIAMGMTTQPRLLLADEPTSALDVTIQAQVVHEIKQLRDRFGASIILVTHNMGVASYLSDKIGVMKDGHLVEFDTREQIIYHPREKYTQDLLEAVPKLGGKRFAKS